MNQSASQTIAQPTSPYRSFNRLPRHLRLDLQASMRGGRWAPVLRNPIEAPIGKLLGGLLLIGAAALPLIADTDAPLPPGHPLAMLGMAAATWGVFQVISWCARQMAGRQESLPSGSYIFPHYLLIVAGPDLTVVPFTGIRNLAVAGDGRTITIHYDAGKSTVHAADPADANQLMARINFVRGNHRAPDPADPLFAVANSPEFADDDGSEPRSRPPGLLLATPWPLLVIAILLGGTALQIALPMRNHACDDAAYQALKHRPAAKPPTSKDWQRYADTWSVHAAEVNQNELPAAQLDELLAKGDLGALRDFVKTHPTLPKPMLARVDARVKDYFDKALATYLSSNPGASADAQDFVTGTYAYLAAHHGGNVPMRFLPGDFTAPPAVGPGGHMNTGAVFSANGVAAIQGQLQGRVTSAMASISGGNFVVVGGPAMDSINADIDGPTIIGSVSVKPTDDVYTSVEPAPTSRNVPRGPWKPEYVGVEYDITLEFCAPGHNTLVISMSLTPPAEFTVQGSTLAQVTVYDTMTARALDSVSGKVIAKFHGN